MEIETNAENRKELAKALAEHFGESAVYQGPPTFAYRIGNITVDRNSRIVFEDEGLAEEIRSILSENGAECTQGHTAQESVQEEGGINVRLPMGETKPQGIINLINMLHAKQYLINKAVGEERFSIENGLVEELAGKTFENTGEAVSFITSRSGECRGLEFSEDSIAFTGFPYTEDPTAVRVYCELAAAMLRKASENKRVNPKPTIEENEKYYMRVWLVALGFDGSSGKEVRNYLVKHLKGHTAFRTEADRIKWQEARKAAKENS